MLIVPPLNPEKAAFGQVLEDLARFQHRVAAVSEDPFCLAVAFEIERVTELVDEGVWVLSVACRIEELQS